jgi:hypothetical protein
MSQKLIITIKTNCLFLAARVGPPKIEPYFRRSVHGRHTLSGHRNSTLSFSCLHPSISYHISLSNPRRWDSNTQSLGHHPAPPLHTTNPLTVARRSRRPSSPGQAMTWCHLSSSGSVEEFFRLLKASEEPLHKHMKVTWLMAIKSMFLFSNNCSSYCAYTGRGQCSDQATGW